MTANVFEDWTERACDSTIRDEWVAVAMQSRSYVD
jgi:hypothetical protein